jgi:hypothetical protein
MDIKYYNIKEGAIENTDDSLCGCTIIDKDHEATITTFGNYFISDSVKLQEFQNYFDLLYNKVNSNILFLQKTTFFYTAVYRFI